MPPARRWAGSSLLELLGEGGQGAVYRAQDTASGSIVALKVLRAERAGRPEALRRFRKEARLLAEANNPHVVNLLEFNEDDRVPYLVLEFVAGKNLGDLLAEQTRLDEPTALAIMADVARALAGPHDRGIVHRDVKPANILLLESQLDLQPGRPRRPIDMAGEAGRRAAGDDRGPAAVPASFRVKLSDFGLARHVVDSQSLAMTEAGALLGHAALHGPRAVERPGDRSPHRRLRDGSDPLPPAGRPAAVRWARPGTSC